MIRGGSLTHDCTAPFRLTSIEEADDDGGHKLIRQFDSIAEVQSMTSASRITLRVIYSGHVQGVGFRYATCEIAQDRPVSGFVRNRHDGTVELVVRGALDDVREFLNAVAARFLSHITLVEESPLATDEEFDSFDIRR